ncbi:MAG TPA: hypothetical protein VGG19_11320 [Tepidisphaeraceae bacterium]|jgi:hypothetical protein
MKVERFLAALPILSCAAFSYGYVLYSPQTYSLNTSLMEEQQPIPLPSGAPASLAGPISGISSVPVAFAMTVVGNFGTI